MVSVWADALSLLEKFGADAFTVVVAAMCVVLRCCQLAYKGKSITRDECSNALLNGASLFPFILIFFAAFSTKVFEAAAASKLSLALAGGVGFLFVMGEVLKPASLKDLPNGP